jgi:hypothetical protein
MQLVDCVTGDAGCGGGRPQDALNYVANNFITTAANYPYEESNHGETSGAQPCKAMKGSEYFGLSSPGYVQGTVNSATALMQAS